MVITTNDSKLDTDRKSNITSNLLTRLDNADSIGNDYASDNGDVELTTTKMTPCV